MNGMHNLGGVCGLGPILNEEDEPYFHHEWEHRVLPLFASLFIGGHFNADEFRHTIECMDPTHYLEASYYKHWLHVFETLLLERGVITADELWGGSASALCAPDTPVLTQDIMMTVVSTGASAHVSHDITPRFKTGDRVRAKSIDPTTYTRLSCYVHGKIGRIETGRGAFIIPDTTMHGPDEHLQHVYSASFITLELRGAPRSGNVYIDLWGDYLGET